MVEGLFMVNTNASEHKDRITTKASVFFLVKLFSGTLISIINKISVKYCYSFLFFHFNTEICSPQLLVLTALDLFK